MADTRDRIAVGDGRDDLGYIGVIDIVHPAVRLTQHFLFILPHRLGGKAPRPNEKQDRKHEPTHILRFHHFSFFFRNNHHSPIAKLKLPEKIRATRLQMTTSQWNRFWNKSRKPILIKKAPVAVILYFR